MDPSRPLSFHRFAELLEACVREHVRDVVVDAGDASISIRRGRRAATLQRDAQDLWWLTGRYDDATTAPFRCYDARHTVEALRVCAINVVNVLDDRVDTPAFSTLKRLRSSGAHPPRNLRQRIRRDVRRDDGRC